MAEGDQQLPADEELFEQPHQPIIVDELMAVQDAENPKPTQLQYHEQFQSQPYYEQPAVSVFQPSAYVAPTFVAQPIQTSSGSADAAPEGSPENCHEANEHTVWIDSDSDDDTEEAILRQNFYLPYSDHNYDCADPSDRVIHPQEGIFPIIGGLREDGTISTIWVPGEEHGHVEQPAGIAPTVRQPGRPVAPYSVQGAPVEYIQQQQPLNMQRNPLNRADHYRYANQEYGNGGVPFRGQIRNHNTTIMRGARGEVVPANLLHHQQQQQQHPLHQTVRGANVMPQRRSMAQNPPQPGSYQHVTHATPGGLRRSNLGGAGVGAGVGARGALHPGQMRQSAVVRPLQMSRPIADHHQHQQEREFVEVQMQHTAPAPAPPPPIQRRIADMAPHRMTQEQREQMARSRQAAPQFPGPQRLLLRGQQHVESPAVGAGVVIRSPPMEQVEPRKFQVKVTDTYSAPIQKVSDQLPAQLTEDPPDVKPTTSEELPQADTLPTIRSPTRNVSPMKSAVSKPTPPHRLTQDEKNAHLARLLADKDKQAAPSLIQTPPQPHQQTPQPHQQPHQQTLQQPHQQPHQQPPHQQPHQPHQPHQPPHQPHQPHPHQQLPPHQQPPPLPNDQQIPLHQVDTDTLAIVQSVFDASKPRYGKTKQDNEAISKIADQLRVTAEKFENFEKPYYEIQGTSVNSSAAVEQPHRPRGRPRGSTGPQRNRWPSGQEPPVPPHRVGGGGGARTLPPRAQQPQQNGHVHSQANKQDAKQNNSDSDSDADANEEDWTMRCHCGMDHGTGATIECEQCKTWQHTFCMGLTMQDETDGYLCELCRPRRLKVSQAEAIRIQKREIAKVKKATEAAMKKGGRKRKSEPVPVVEVEPPKKAVLPRKSAPALEKRPPQLNDYSKSAAALLATIQQTAGADVLLQESSDMKRAKRMYVSENVEALVTTMMVNQRAVVLEVNGHVSMMNEVKRQPGGGGYVFVYDGLMKGTTGEDMGNGHEYVCVDTKRKGNDSKFTRRSCEPNCVLKHVLGSYSTLGIMIVATKDIPYNQEVTLPFDLDWGMSDQPLECADHVSNMSACPFEQQRQLLAAQRAREKEEKEAARNRKVDEEKKLREERKRLEDEVRRERAAAQKKLEEEEREQERLEAEAKVKAEVETQVEEDVKTQVETKAETKKEEAQTKKDEEAQTKKEEAQTKKEEAQTKKDEAQTKKDETQTKKVEAQTKKQESKKKKKDAPEKVSKVEKPTETKAENEETRPKKEDTKKKNKEEVEKPEKPSTPDTRNKKEEAQTNKKNKEVENPATPTTHTPSSSSRAHSQEPQKLTREERLVQQAEQRFKRQEEDEKRKKARAEKADSRERRVSSRKSLAAPAPPADASPPSTSAASQTARRTSKRYLPSDEELAKIKRESVRGAENDDEDMDIPEDMEEDDEEEEPETSEPRGPRTQKIVDEDGWTTIVKRQ
uniref:SET domain-containing protein n=1 Tax=Caenorhabditis japonica TaxID=281687 RepID=A0A8R1HT69_CAEJA